VFVDDVQDLAQALLDNAHDGDVMVCMGAGSVGQVAAQVLERSTQQKVKT
jgi:UDP-N-acetylmuramate--alanine ligase